MDWESAFKIAVGICGMLGGWVLKTISDKLDGLKSSEVVMMQKIQAIELLVADQYVKKIDLEKLATAIFNKLDRIEDKLDSKADKE